jgi:membrane-associated phospholipid phosphatase
MTYQRRRWLVSVFITGFFLFGIQTKISFAQDNDAPAVPDASASDSSGPQDSPQTDRDVSILKLPRNILQDQINIVLFPKQLAEGKHRWPTIGIVAGTTALIASDPYTAPAFRNTARFNEYNRDLSDISTGAFIAAVPAAIYGVGLVTKNSYAKDTALLAGEAVVDGLLLDMPFKAIAGRRQPSNYSGPGPYSDSFFHGSHNPIGSGGFYSMHAFAAASVATVIAERYRKHRWVPILAYGLAGAICFSRITRSDHFSSDVFFGGAMGIVIARFAVLPRHD